MATPILPPARPHRKWRALRAVSALVFREMTTTYGRSPGGYLWAVLHPLATIAILAVAFSMVLRSPSLGASFLLFYASAVLPLRLFQELSATVADALRFNRSLLVFPAVTYVDSVAARAILCLLTQSMVNLLLLSAIFLFDDIREIIAPQQILAAYGLTVLLGLGWGMLNCFLTFGFPVWKTIWSILTRPLLLISGIFYIYEDLPQVAQSILWFNPLLHITGLARTGYYATYAPDYISVVYVLVWALIPMVFGTLLLHRFHRDILFK